MSASSTSRCVTARTTVGWIVEESPTPASRSRASASSRAEPEAADVELDEVRLDLVEVDREAGRMPALGEPARAGVVVRQTLDVVVEGVHAGGGDDARLAHGAAEQVLLAPRALDRLGRAREKRAERTAQALRQAEGHGVEVLADRRRLDARRDDRVEEARAVEVGSQATLARGSRDRRQLVERPAAPARGVVGVLDGEHARPLVGRLRARTPSRRRARPTPKRPARPSIVSTISPEWTAAPPYS